MKRVLTTLVLAFSVLLAACGGSGGSPGATVEPVSPEASPDTMSPEASPS
jgi:hypothetical protein